MKAVCIKIEENQNYEFFLTVGKVYEYTPDVDILDPLYFYVLDDSGKWSWYPKFQFKPIEEVREDKLKQLGL